MPEGSVFIDTNVLLYLHDRRNNEKRGAAEKWLSALADRQLARTNLQSLNELAHVLLRKKWFDAPETAFAVVDAFSAFGSEPLTQIEVFRARTLHDQVGYSWWDCLLLASALEMGCSHFLSEDLHDGRTIEGLTIVDPFAHSPEQILVS